MSGLPRERSGHPPPAALQHRREMMAVALAKGTWKTTPTAEEATLGGVRVLRFLPPDQVRGTLVHLHGGAFRQGCAEMSGPFAAALASRCAIEVLCPAYRLAPEHPFPAALNDVMAVVETLMPSSRPLLIGGDSAGGGLAASTVRLCIDRGVPVRALALLSAWLDLTVSSSSYEDNACTDPLFSRAAAEEATLLYLQGLSAREPLVSPVLGSVVGFPPTFVSIGAGEVLADEGRRFHHLLQTAGIRAELLAIAGMEHVAVTRNPQLTGAAQTLDALVRFIDRLLL